MMVQIQNIAIVPAHPRAQDILVRKTLGPTGSGSPIPGGRRNLQGHMCLSYVEAVVIQKIEVTFI